MLYYLKLFKFYINIIIDYTLILLLIMIFQKSKIFLKVSKSPLIFSKVILIPFFTNKIGSAKKGCFLAVIENLTAFYRNKPHSEAIVLGGGASRVHFKNFLCFFVVKVQDYDPEIK